MGPGMWATSPGPRSHGRVASPYRLGVRRDTGVVTPRPAPRRLTPRGRVVLGLVGALLVVGSLAIARAVLHGPPDCTVRADGRTVDLDRRQAERAATWSTTSSGGRSAARLDASALARDLAISATDARAVVAAFTGRVPAAVTCRHGGAATSETDRLDSHGLTPRAEAVREDLRARFPGVPLGGFAPGGVHTGHMPGSAHYEGRAIDAFVRPVNPQQGAWLGARGVLRRERRSTVDQHGHLRRPDLDRASRRGRLAALHRGDGRQAACRRTHPRAPRPRARRRGGLSGGAGRSRDPGPRTPVRATGCA